MNDALSTRILTAVEGNPAAIRTVAAARAKGDADSIRAALATCGVSLSEDETTRVLDVVHGRGSGHAFTVTYT